MLHIIIETEVTVEDIQAVITMCLRHRLRKDPLETIDSGDKVQKVFDSVFNRCLKIKKNRLSRIRTCIRDLEGPCPDPLDDEPSLLIKI